MIGTNEYWRRFQIPNTEKHLFAFISAGGGKNNALEELKKMWHSFSGDLLRRIEADMRLLSPLAGESGERKPAGNFEAEPGEEEPETALAEMQNVLIRFISGDYDANLCYAVIFTLNGFEKDIRRQHRIRTRILYPMLKKPERP